MTGRSLGKLQEKEENERHRHDQCDRQQTRHVRILRAVHHNVREGDGREYRNDQHAPYVDPGLDSLIFQHETIAQIQEDLDPGVGPRERFPPIAFPVGHGSGSSDMAR
jgi:hypothetical protein